MAWEQNTSLQALLEQRLREESKSQELLEEKSKELELRQQEAQQVTNQGVREPPLRKGLVLHRS